MSDEKKQKTDELGMTDEARREYEEIHSRNITTVPMEIRYDMNSNSDPFRFHISVNERFFDNPNLKGKDVAHLEKNFTLYDLAKDFEVGRYFHSTSGPANEPRWRGKPIHVKDEKNNVDYGLYREYWVQNKDGNTSRRLSNDEAKRIIHDTNFTKKFNKMLDGEDSGPGIMVPNEQGVFVKKKLTE